MKKLALLSILLFMSPLAAQAGIYIEPFFSFVKGSGTLNYVETAPTAQTISTTTNDKGTMFGGRLGLTFTPMLIVGADYTAGKINVDPTNGAFSSNEFTIADIGGFLSFELPAFARAYATYIASAKLTDGGRSYKGNGVKLGVGYKGLPLVSINFEVIKNTYTTFDDQSTTVNSFKFKDTIYTIGVSVPLNL